MSLPSHRAFRQLVSSEWCVTLQYYPGIEFGFNDILLRQADKETVSLLLSNMGEFPRFDISDLILNQLN